MTCSGFRWSGNRARAGLRERRNRTLRYDQSRPQPGRSEKPSRHRRYRIARSASGPPRPKVHYTQAPHRPRNPSRRLSESPSGRNRFPDPEKALLLRNRRRDRFAGCLLHRRGLRSPIRNPAPTGFRLEPEAGHGRRSMRRADRRGMERTRLERHPVKD